MTEPLEGMIGMAAQLVAPQGRKSPPGVKWVAVPLWLSGARAPGPAKGSSALRCVHPTAAMTTCIGAPTTNRAQPHRNTHNAEVDNAFRHKLDIPCVMMPSVSGRM